MNEQRDKDLGARLDELDVREHGAEYWNAVIAAAEPELERLRASQDPGGAPATSSSPRLLHALRGRRTLWYVAAGAAAAALAAFFLLAGLPGGPAGRLAGPPPATAEELITSVLAALDGPQGLRGEMKLGTVEQGVVVPQVDVAFVCARDGSQRLVVDYAGPAGWTIRPRGWPSWPTSPEAGDRVTTVHDASSRRTQEILDYGPDFGDSGSGPLQDVSGRPLRYMWSDFVGAAPAEPDLGLGNGPFALLRLRAYLRTMLSDSAVRMTSASVNGRSVYVLRAKVITADTFMVAEPPQPLSIVIDAATRLPLTYRWSRGGMNWQASFDMTTEKKPPDRSEFELDMPPANETLNGGVVYPGTQFTTRDWGFDPLPLADATEVERLLGPVAPAFPGWMPQGFARTAATAADRGGLERSPLNGEDIIVSLCYRRGFDQAFVSLRVDPRRIDSSSTSDPFLPEQERWMRRQWASHTTDVRLQGGTYRGAVAHVVVDPSVWPHLWVKKAGLVATVAGDLTRDEMVRIANSLESWKAPGGE